MPARAALVHYHEIGLKGRNRSAFERRLQGNLTSALRDLPVGKVARIASRLIVPIYEGAAVPDVLERVRLIPGVSHVGDVRIAERDERAIEEAALEALDEAGQGAETFAVDARRSSTDWPISSMEMNKRVGAFLRERTGLAVDLGAPDVTCWIEVVQGDAYVYARRVEGPGGLPVGTSGKVVALLSAGIDSPIAAWRMMKRGTVVVAVHFSGRPQTSDLSERLVLEIGEVLERTGGLGRVYVVPFGDLQKEIALASPPDLRVLLYRRLMVRVAEAVAESENAKALVTGESLGQVASQTLENVAVVDAVAALPVLRPLIGMDKLEIIRQARSVGTYELSTQKHDDCCTLFMPRTPATHASVPEVEEGEADLDPDRMVAEAVGSMTWRDYRCPAYRPPDAERSGSRGQGPEGER